ncbi:hypothetical protein HOY82DRAFT_479085 [Tuber indicum]|nr:hypothetical protein HOY82DRAFT_479085 [Tuber indicum]
MIVLPSDCIDLQSDKPFRKRGFSLSLYIVTCNDAFSIILWCRYSHDSSDCSPVDSHEKFNGRQATETEQRDRGSCQSPTSQAPKTME